MRSRRVLRHATCLTTLVALCAACGPRASSEAPSDTTATIDPRAADDAGLLVAVAAGEEGQDTASATLLLDWRDGTPRLGAATPGILVPRAAGFRWMGSVTRCTIEQGNYDWVGTQAWLDSDQALWVARPGDTVRVTLAGAPCTSLSHALYLARMRIKRVRDSVRAASPDVVRDEHELEVADQPIDVGDYCTIGTRTIDFVDDTLVAYARRRTTTEFCSPAKYETGGNNVVRRMDATPGTDSIGVNALLPAHARDSLLAIFTGELDCVIDADSTGIDHRWTMRHEQGRWRLSAWFDGATVCRGGQEWNLDVPPPALARDTRLAMPWDSLSHRTGAWDAATSPSGRWTMLVRGDSLFVARVSAERADSAALTVPLPATAHRVVMLRWLGAAEVAQLRAALPAQRRPVVQVVAPPPGDEGT